MLTGAGCGMWHGQKVAVGIWPYRFPCHPTSSAPRHLLPLPSLQPSLQTPYDLQGRRLWQLCHLPQPQEGMQSTLIPRRGCCFPLWPYLSVSLMFPISGSRSLSDLHCTPTMFPEQEMSGPKVVSHVRAEEEPAEAGSTLPPPTPYCLAEGGGKRGASLINL